MTCYTTAAIIIIIYTLRSYNHWHHWRSTVVIFIIPTPLPISSHSTATATPPAPYPAYLLHHHCIHCFCTSPTLFIPPLWNTHATTTISTPMEPFFPMLLWCAIFSIISAPLPTHILSLILCWNLHQLSPHCCLCFHLWTTGTVSLMRHHFLLHHPFSSSFIITRLCNFHHDCPALLKFNHTTSLLMKYI